MPPKFTSTYTTIPAQPGWSIALFSRFLKEDDNQLTAAFFYQPIIGWEIERTESEYHPAAGKPSDATHTYRLSVPLTADGDREGQRYAIKGPDGKFLVPAEATFDTEQEALEYFIEQDL